MSLMIALKKTKKESASVFSLVVVRCILYLWEILLQRWMMECYMSSFTTATLPVVVEKWCLTAWATPSEY